MVRDQAPGAPDFELEIELDSVEVTAAELIRGRVTAELARIGGSVPRPIVPASEAEQALNGPRKEGRRLDVAQETERALRAFKKGRFVVVVDGRQVNEADDKVTLTPDSTVTFVRLVPVRGG